MSTQQIQINPNTPPTPTQPAVFSPQAVTASAGDNLTWVNNDSQDHWPAPSAADKTGWFAFQTPGGSESPGDVALGPNIVTVTAATPGNPTVFTTQQAAPANGVTVVLGWKAPNPASPPYKWQTPTAGQSFVVTNLGANSCSIPLDSSAFGPLVGTLSIGVPYKLNYVCALHPAETGCITVNPQK